MKQRKRMREIMEEAKKRRARFLREFSKLGITLDEFGAIHNMTGERMGQIIKKARQEDALSHKKLA